MRIKFLILLVCYLLPVIGCARGNVELLEAQLRNREAELRSLSGQLELREQELARSEREIRLLQQQLADKPVAPEAIAKLAQIEKIEINSSLTGALDQDDYPGDDVLNVVVSPLDGLGDVVRLDGDIAIEALDPSLPENERSLGRWQIGLADAESSWHDGFIGQGYQLTTPWQRLPRSKELILLARYKTPDGREFSATRNISVNPVPDGTPGLLPLPQAKTETPPLPDIRPQPSAVERVSFEEFVKAREASQETAATPKANGIPVITPSSAPLVELKEPIATAEQPDIPLPEVFPEPEERERPPFVE